MCTEASRKITTDAVFQQTKQCILTRFKDAHYANNHNSKGQQTDQKISSITPFIFPPQTSLLFYTDTVHFCTERGYQNTQGGPSLNSVLLYLSLTCTITCTLYVGICFTRLCFAEPQEHPSLYYQDSFSLKINGNLPRFDIPM